MSKVVWLELNALTSTTDAQAESLSKVHYLLALNALTSITDEQAESLSNVFQLRLNGLNDNTLLQAESLSKMKHLEVDKDLQPLIDKFKNE